MIIERTKDEVIIRLPANFDTEGIERFINQLYKEAKTKSAAKRVNIDELTKSSLVDLSGFKFDRDSANDYDE